VIEVIEDVNDDEGAPVVVADLAPPSISPMAASPMKITMTTIAADVLRPRADFCTLRIEESAYMNPFDLSNRERFFFAEGWMALFVQGRRRV
jgi:hypothetical protein